jgi:hypothetical protein
LQEFLSKSFVSIHDPIANLFHLPRNQFTAADYRAARSQAFQAWAEIAGARLAAQSPTRAAPTPESGPTAVRRRSS